MLPLKYAASFPWLLQAVCGRVPQLSTCSFCKSVHASGAHILAQAPVATSGHSWGQFTHSENAHMVLLSVRCRSSGPEGPPRCKIAISAAGQGSEFTI